MIKAEMEVNFDFVCCNIAMFFDFNRLNKYTTKLILKIINTKEPFPLYLTQKERFFHLRVMRIPIRIVENGGSETLPIC